MQEQTFQTQLSRFPVRFLVSVTFIANEWMTRKLQVHANLVGASRHRQALHQAVFAESA